MITSIGPAASIQVNYLKLHKNIHAELTFYEHKSQENKETVRGNSKSQNDLHSL